MRRYVTDTKKIKEIEKERSIFLRSAYSSVFTDDDLNDQFEEYEQEIDEGPPVLYFAYGSNMCVDQMRTRCPSFVKMGKATLARRRWIISARGYANVIAAKKHKVEGVLYTISKRDEGLLDIYEGVAQGSYYKVILPVEFMGQMYDALVYIDKTVGEGLPKERYARKINSGVVDAKLSAKYIETYIRRFVPPNSKLPKAVVQ